MSKPKREHNSKLIIVKVIRDTNYATINLTSLKDERLSYGAKGLHCTLMTLPTDWKPSHKGFQEIAKATKHQETKYSAELQKYGYLQIEPIRKGGRIEYWVWTVLEVPHNHSRIRIPESGRNPEPERVSAKKSDTEESKESAPDSDIPDSGRPDSGRRQQSINPIINKSKNQLNQKEDKPLSVSERDLSFELTLFKEITGGWLPDDLEIRKYIEAYVERTTKERMIHALANWKWKGYRVENLDWLSDWSINGVPKHINKNHQVRPSAESREIMDWFNRRFEKKYIALSYHQLIQELIKAGYNVDHIKITIDRKHDQLLDEDFDGDVLGKWFKSQILFKLENFEGYFNAYYRTEWNSNNEN